MSLHWKRIFVSLCAALSVPCAIIAGVNIASHFDFAVIFLGIAMILNFIYVYHKPYWSNGNGNT
ncbi:MAG: hypothetical protein E6L02_04300 [Thaumarchaeota archaeon]|nr:MAG: hypothetical protein E6L02_04300 [Nitrososphaerota archaeon]